MWEPTWNCCLISWRTCKNFVFKLQSSYSNAAGNTWAILDQTVLNSYNWLMLFNKNSPVVSKSSLKIFFPSSSFRNFRFALQFNNNSRGSASLQTYNKLMSGTDDNSSETLLLSQFNQLQLVSEGPHFLLFASLLSKLSFSFSLFFFLFF